MALPHQLKLFKTCHAKMANFNCVTMATWSRQTALRLRCGNMLYKSQTHELPVTGGTLSRNTIRCLSHYPDTMLSCNRAVLQSNISVVAVAASRKFHTQMTLLAGHNKWSNIKHIKGAKDHARGLIFAKYAKLIKGAVKDNGPNPATNSQLASLIEKAQAQDMPKANIENAIKNAIKTGAEVVSLYEIKGPGGSALLVEVSSDKPTRAKQELARILKKTGSTIGAAGSLMYAFEHKGVVRVNPKSSADDQPALNLDQATEAAIEVGAEDVQEAVNDENEPIFMFICNPSDVNTVKEGLCDLAYTVESADREYISTIDYLVELSEANLDKVSHMIQTIEEHPEVSKIYDNIVAAN